MSKVKLTYGTLIKWDEQGKTHLWNFDQMRMSKVDKLILHCGNMLYRVAWLIKAWKNNNT